MVLLRIVFTAIMLIALNLSALSQTEAVLSAFKQSYAYEKSGEYAKAIEVLKSVYDEKSYEINVRIAWLSYSNGLFSESTAFYSKAIALYPLSIEARLGAVYPASALAKWDEVMKHYQKIVEIDPKHSTANYRLGSIYYGKQEFQKAYAHLETVVNHYPFDYSSLLLFAWANFQLGKMREAKILFNKVLLYSPDDASAKEGLSLIK